MLTPFLTRSYFFGREEVSGLCSSAHVCHVPFGDLCERHRTGEFTQNQRPRLAATESLFSPQGRNLKLFKIT